MVATALENLRADEIEALARAAEAAADSLPAPMTEREVRAGQLESKLPGLLASVRDARVLLLE